MTIRIFITGGTFDKEYDELSGQLCFRHTHLPGLLTQGRCLLDYEITTLMLKDSLDIDENDREQIINACEQSPQSQIVLTHGTDTMSETARLLAGRVPAKTIVLTGAMIPSSFGGSDGLFNLGSALAFVQVLPAGVYIAMNGQVFSWDNVRKNRTAGRFETISPVNNP